MSAAATAQGAERDYFNRHLMCQNARCLRYADAHAQGDWEVKWGPARGPSGRMLRCKRCKYATMVEVPGWTPFAWMPPSAVQRYMDEHALELFVEAKTNVWGEVKGYHVYTSHTSVLATEELFKTEDDAASWAKQHRTAVMLAAWEANFKQGT